MDGAKAERLVEDEYREHSLRELATLIRQLRDFDVQYRVAGGTWRTIRNDTIATSITLRDRVDGRAYYLRVRATDRRGNVGAWTSASKIWVP